MQPIATTTSKDSILSLLVWIMKWYKRVHFRSPAITETLISRSLAEQKLHEVELYARKLMVCVSLSPSSNCAIKGTKRNGTMYCLSRCKGGVIVYSLLTRGNYFEIAVWMI